MNILDKVYNLTVDIKNIDTKYNSYAKFFDDDRETSVIKVKILNNNSPIDLENCSVEAYFVLANNTYHNETCKIINSSEGIVELQLCQKCLVKGKNIVRLSILKDNEIANTPIITYEVRKGLYSDNPNFNDDPLTPILSQMLLDIKVTKVNQIELQERYEKTLPKIEGKIEEVDNAIDRVNNAIASGTQDLEVKEARVDKNGKSYSKLGDRLDSVDSQLAHNISKLENLKVINVKDFGAKGDGITDDTQAIKNAIEKVYSSTEYGELYFPGGIYIVSEPLFIHKHGEMLTIRGQHYRSTIIKAIREMDYVIKIGDDGKHGSYNINSIGVDCGDYANCAIDGKYAIYSVLEKVYCTTSKDNSILLKIGSWCNRVENCMFYGQSDISSDKFNYRKSIALNIENNISTNNLIINKNVFGIIETAIQIDDYANDVHISENTFDCVGRIITATKGLKNLSFTKNYCEACGGTNSDKYTKSYVMYKDGSYIRELYSPIILHEDIGMVTNYRVNALISNNQFANCCNEDIIAISLPGNVVIKDNDFYGEKYTYNNFVKVFGKGVYEGCYLEIQDSSINMNECVKYDNNFGSYYYNDGTVTINKKNKVINELSCLSSTPTINGAKVGYKDELNINNSKELSLTFKLGSVDRINPSKLLFDFTGGNNIKVSVSRKDGSGYIFYERNISKDRGFVGLREENNITENVEYTLDVKSDNEVKINSIVLETCNSKNKLTSLI